MVVFIRPCEAGAGQKPGMRAGEGPGLTTMASVTVSFLGLINNKSTNHACRATHYRPSGRATAGNSSYCGAGTGADSTTAQHPLFGGVHAGATGN